MEEHMRPSWIYPIDRKDPPVIYKWQWKVYENRPWIGGVSYFSLILLAQSSESGRSPKCLANRWRKGQSLRDSPSPLTGDLWRLIIENGAYHLGKIRRYIWCVYIYIYIYMEMIWVYMKIYEVYMVYIYIYMYISIMEIYGDDTMGSDSTLWGLW